MADDLIEVEVAYAGTQRQVLLTLQVPAGTTMREAVLRADIAAQFPDDDLLAQPMGLFGRRVQDPASHVLMAGDRVEIYRPLIADPMEVRRMRAARTARPSKKRG